MVIRRLLAVASSSLAVVLGAACTTAPSALRATPLATRTAPHQVSAAGQNRPAGNATKDITLAFAGDVHFTGRTRLLLADPSTAFGPVAAVLRSAAFAAVNLETAVTDTGTPQPKTYHFRAPVTAFPALRDAGVDLVTMANNHVLDYGQVDLASTLAAAKAARSPYLGIRTNAPAAWPPALTTNQRSDI